MKSRQVMTGLIALIGLGIAFGVGRYFRPNVRIEHGYMAATVTTCPDKTRCITVSAGSTAGTCSVDYPVARLHYTDQDSDHVEWFSSDHTYSVSFINVTPPPGSTPLPTTYTPESPLVPPQEPAYFDPSHPAGPFNVKHKDKYYYYAIFDSGDPSNPSNPKLCKVSTDDQDTGLSVKR